MEVGDLVRLCGTNRVAVVLCVNPSYDYFGSLGGVTVNVHWIKRGITGGAYFNQLELINENKTKSRRFS